MVCTQVHCCQISGLSHKLPLPSPSLSENRNAPLPECHPERSEGTVQGKSVSLGFPIFIDRFAPGTKSEIFSGLG